MFLLISLEVEIYLTKLKALKTTNLDISRDKNFSKQNN
jgi:hypothetical protein